MSLYNKIIDLQKLNMAWKRVKMNKPSPGVDGVTWDVYDASASEENKRLHKELAEKAYECKPVKNVTLYKEEKERQIALYSMRDKVVQQSIAEELKKMYDHGFSPQCYAYRENRSALQAVQEIEKQISTHGYTQVLKIDISIFFDTIRWDKLQGILKERIREDDVLELIRKECMAPTIDSEGNLVSKELGIHQGSCIAPIISNIYLMKFDLDMAKCDCFFLRYSDDMLFLSDSHEKLQEILARATTILGMLGLSVSEKKTILCSLKDGIDFLGYRFAETGKSITSKAEGQLAGRLETVWLLNRNDSVENRIRKMSEILNGWEQYFRGDRKPADILEFTAAAYLLRPKRGMPELAKVRRELSNIYPDIMKYLAALWHESELCEMELFEYEQYYGFLAEESGGLQLDAAGIGELINLYEAFVEEPSKDNALEIMQKYSDLHLYANAAKVAAYADNIDVRTEVIHANVSAVAQGKHTKTEAVREVTDEQIEKFMNLFAGREDMYATVDYINGKKQLTDQLQPLTKDVMRRHMQGEIIVASYNQRQNATVKALVMDLDISKRVLITCGGDEGKIKEHLQKTADIAIKIGDWFRRKNLYVRYEFSGYRGYHIWLFFESWIPTYYVNMLQDVLEADLADILDDDVTLEFFPNKTKLKQGRNGQKIKLPLSYHAEAHIRSALLMEDLSECENLSEWLDSAPKCTLDALKKVLAVGSERQEAGLRKVVDDNLDIFGELPSNISEILRKCNLMRYLCRKAYETGYLTHFERLSILYVFGHVGEEGERFVHQVMSYTLNYKYNTTERFIRKCPEKPISCGKLREQYKRITAEIGCSCAFKRSKNCYPSPVLHAISLSTDEAEQVTLPVSQTLPKEKSQHITEELNIHKKAQALAVKILELKKQRRGIDNSVRKVERELELIFDEEKTDSLELEMGLLVRRKIESGYEWLIEI